MFFAIGSSPVRAQDDTALLGEARRYAEIITGDTLRNPLRHRSFSSDNPKLSSSQGRTTLITYRTDTLGRIRVIETEQAASQRIWHTAYYLRGDTLLYATEAEELNLKSGEDAGRIMWRAEYVFRSGRLAGLSSNGHGKSEDDGWTPEAYVPAAFRAALLKVKAHHRRAAARSTR